MFFFDHRDTIIQDEKYLILQAMKNVIITCHQAFLTKEAIEGIAATTVANLDAWKATRVSENDLI